MNPKISLESSSVWFVVFLVTIGILWLVTGAVMEAAISSLILVGIVYVAYQLFS